MRPNQRVASVVAALVLASASQLAAQAPQPDPRTLNERLKYFQPQIEKVVATAGADDVAIGALADVINVNMEAFAFYAMPPTVMRNSLKEFLLTAARTRVDEQLGAAPSGGGSSGVLSRTGLSSLFGFSLDSGAVTQTIDQNMATLRANVGGLARFLSNQDVFEGCDQSDFSCKTQRELNRAEFSASFNVGDPGSVSLKGATPGSTDQTGFLSSIGRKQFRSATFRIGILNGRDLGSTAYRQKWLAWLDQNRPKLAEAGQELLVPVNDVAELLKTKRVDKQTVDGTHFGEYFLWREETRIKLKAAHGNDAMTREFLDAQLEDLLTRARKLDPDFDRKLQNVQAGYIHYAAISRDLASSIVTAPALTLEITYAEPALQPRTATINMAYAWSLAPRRQVNPGTITAQFGATMFTSSQDVGAGASARTRDVHLAVQFARPLGPANSAAQFSLGIYAQHQVAAGIINIPGDATTLPGTSIPLPPGSARLLTEKGTTCAVQALLTIRMLGGVKVPIGVSWANRTDLVSGRDVRANIGFSLDTSQLLLFPGIR